ncbi:class I SAM-dependent methyltransferase [Pseudonocardia kujensis]|uniref:class I SAM-dependent methyltransferase n=1 Tax=Pseudonocardia kujensis TaxID=1128675 RepID=UPI001E412CC5|nr:class I SAM-dependent methyltransferase [Pseudonocardia kujensis]MCE0764799.1 class I SAM-dependent methyltransferase [Pseudonocardia kujensis]
MDTDEELAHLHELAGPTGTELFAAIAAGLDGRPLSDDAALRIGTALRRTYPAPLVAEALTQAQLRERAAGKFDRAGSMFLTRAGWEQASPEVVARHRAPRFAGARRLADLCCGIGGDLLALAPGREVLAVDRDPVHLWMARHNAAVYDSDVHTLLADVREADLTGVDAVFVDPARRSARGRMRTGDSEPPFAWCFGLPVPAIGVKAAPGLDHDVVPEGWELEFVAVDRDLKEAVAWSPALATTRTRATVLPAGDTIVATEGDAVAVRDPGRYLLDPSPAVTRAGAVEELARRTGTWKIDERIAFLSADEPVATPFARTLEVIDSGPWDQKSLPRRLRELDIGAVDIRRRGLAGDVDALHKRLKLRGSRRATLVMTRVRDRPWGLVCV